ncbi:MAG: hypothetical protein ABIN74_11790 [Ferruginibacter sp.]
MPLPTKRTAVFIRNIDTGEYLKNNSFGEAYYFDDGLIAACMFHPENAANMIKELKTRYWEFDFETVNAEETIKIQSR